MTLKMSNTRPQSARVRSAANRSTKERSKNSLTYITENQDESTPVNGQDQDTQDDDVATYQTRQQTTGRSAISEGRKKRGSRATTVIADDESFLAADTDDEMSNNHQPNIIESKSSPTSNMLQSTGDLKEEAETDDEERSSGRPFRGRQRKHSHRRRAVKAANKDAADAGSGDEQISSDVKPTKSSNVSRKPVSSSSSRQARHTSADRPKTTSDVSRKAAAQSSGYQLAATNNSDIKDWLRKKNKLMRRKRAEERRQERRKKREEEAKLKEMQAKQQVSAERVKNWMNEKRMEEKLLKQRQSSDAVAVNVGMVNKITQVINQTFQLQVTEKPMTVDVAIRPTKQEQAVTPQETKQVTEKHQQLSPNRPTKIYYGRENSRRSSLSPDVTSQSINAQRLGEHGQRGPRRVMSPKQSVSPSRISFPRENDIQLDMISRKSEARAVQHRMSFDDWLASKKSADAARRSELKKQEEETEANADPLVKDLVRSIARNRIELILKGKSGRVDSGLRMRQTTEHRDLQQPTNTTNTTGDTGVCPYRLTLQDSTARCNDNAAESSGSVQRGTTPADKSDSKPLHSWRPTLVNMTASFKTRVASAPTVRRSASARQGQTSSRTTRSPDRRRTTSPVADNEAERNRINIGRSLVVTRLQCAATPRPDLSPAGAVGRMSYQQDAWERFADFVWDSVNEAEGGGMKIERPEPIGSETEKPDCDLHVDDTDGATSPPQQHDNPAEVQ